MRVDQSQPLREACQHLATRTLSLRPGEAPHAIELAGQMRQLLDWGGGACGSGEGA